ncbi:MAG: hypothetical protein COA79_04425 [Planctomycetota bacterium]|nr:MAG: hypothetical protein COA79_04425 [Planctomycetota bacterium]
MLYPTNPLLKSFLTLFLLIVINKNNVIAEDSLGKKIVTDSQFTNGFCLDNGTDLNLCIELAKNSKLTIYRIEKNIKDADVTRKLLEKNKISSYQVQVLVGSIEEMEFPVFCANIILAQSFSKEMQRLLSPGNGVAYLKNKSLLNHEDFIHSKGPGGFFKTTRTKLKGSANWTHTKFNASNSLYSTDKHIKAPFRILWYGNPESSYGNLWTVRALAANGRFFIADISKKDPKKASIIAKDAYTGVTFWEREVGGPRFSWQKVTKGDDPNYLTKTNEPGKIHNGQFLIINKTIYITDRATCLLINSITGKDIKSLKAPKQSNPKNHWNYVGSVNEQLIGHTSTPYKMPDTSSRYWARKIVREKFGQSTLFAMDINENHKTLWTRGGKSEKELDKDFSQPIAMSSQWIVIRSANDLIILDSLTGKTKSKIKNIDAPGIDYFWEGQISEDNFYLKKYSKRFYSRKLVSSEIISLSKGQITKKETPSRNLMDYFSETKKIVRAPSKCASGTGAGTIYFDRNRYIQKSKGSKNYPGYRSGCRVGALPANGVIHFLPSFGCLCSTFTKTVTLEPGKLNEKLIAAKTNIIKSYGTLPTNQEIKASPEDWPCFRGNSERTAKSEIKLGSKLKKIWDIKLPAKITSPIVVGEKIFIGSKDSQLRAINISDGKVAWSFYSEGAISAAPVYNKGSIYFGSDDGWVYSLAAATGKLHWKFRAAPFARKQSGYGRLLSAWPVKQGLAVKNGKVFVTAGYVPDQQSITYALNTKDGKLIWKTPLKGIIPSSAIVTGPGKIYIPGEKSSPFFQFNMENGSTMKGGSGHFSNCSYIQGSKNDPPEFQKGFILHGGGGITRGHPTSQTKRGYTYNFYPAPWKSKPINKGRYSHVSNFSDAYSFLPIVDEKRIYFKKYEKLVSVSRAEFQSYTAKKRPSRNPKTEVVKKLFTWAKADLPCGIPLWLAQAKNTLITGGKKGLCLINSETGKVISFLKSENLFTDPALSRGKIIVSSADGKLICISTK